MKTRVASAVVMIAITLVCVFISPFTRVLYFAVAGILCAYELSKNLEKLNIHCCMWVMVVYICAQALLTLFHLGSDAYLACFAVAVFLAMFSGVLHKKVGGSGSLATVAGISYPCFLFSMLMIISVSNIWLETLALASLSTWVCDSFALFGGMRFGKHKLAPLVSPHKTVEGCLCGALFSMLAGVVVYFLSQYINPLPLGLCIITALVSSTMGQIGDLAESLVKRMIGIKDFSDLIPGHGGMFDRADSLLFSIPTAYICLFIAGIPA